MTPIFVLQKAILRVIRKKSKGVFVRIFSRSNFDFASFCKFYKELRLFFDKRKDELYDTSSQYGLRKINNSKLPIPKSDYGCINRLIIG